MHGSRAFGGPIMANIGLTNRCNIRCIHCFFYSPFLETPTMRPLRLARMQGREGPGSDEIRRMQTLDAGPERTRRLIAELLRMGTAEFQFSGDGELFLHPQALEFMAQAKEGGAWCNVNTNGTLLNRRLVDELMRIGLDELRITVMAGTEDMYRITHPVAGENTFRLLEDSLLYLSQRKAALGLRSPEVTLVTIVVAQNCEGLRDFAEFALRVRADRVLFRPVDEVGDAGLTRLVLTADQAEQVRQGLVPIKALLDSNRIRHNIFYFLKVFRRQLDTSDFYRIIPCYYGWLSTMIEADGNVYPCCRCYNPLGNVNETGIREIWNSKKYKVFRHSALRIADLKTPVESCDCSSCVHHTANLRVYRYLHPLRGRSDNLRRLSAGNAYSWAG